MDGGVQLIHRVHPDALLGAVEEEPLRRVQHQDAVGGIGGGLPLGDGEEHLPVDQGGVAQLLFLQEQGHIGPPRPVRPQGDTHLPDLPDGGQEGVVGTVPGGQHYRPLPQHQHQLHHDGFGQGAFPQVAEQLLRPAAGEIVRLRPQEARPRRDVFQVGAVPDKVAQDVVVHRLGGLGELAVLPVQQLPLAPGEHAGHGEKPGQNDSQGEDGEDGAVPGAGTFFLHSHPPFSFPGKWGLPPVPAGLAQGGRDML